MTSTDFEAVAGAADFGQPSARKTGRRAEWPFVPVLLVTDPSNGVQSQQQLKGVAFATRAEAVDYATEHVAQARRALAERLAEPRNRALREQYGLPRELAR